MARGRHLYFLALGLDIPNSSGRIGPGVDIRGTGGYVVEEAKRRLCQLTRDERVQAMRAGRMQLWLCLHWASRASHEVPLIGTNGSSSRSSRLRSRRPTTHSHRSVSG
jgi:hypothetical protein